MEATPISGPARVINTKSDSRTKELSGTLHIDKEWPKPRRFASFNPAKVSAVSPDCDNVTISEFFRTTGLR